MIFMKLNKINEFINNSIIVLGNDVNSFLTSYSLKIRYPNKEIHHLIIKDSKSESLINSVFLDNNWVKKFKFRDTLFTKSEYQIKNFYDINNESYDNKINCYKENTINFIKILKDKCIEIGVKIDEGFIRDYQHIVGMDTDPDYNNLFNDHSFISLKFDNLKETKNIHAGFFIDCLGDKSFFFDNDYFDRNTHTANAINLNVKYNHYNKLLPNDMMLSATYKNKDNKTGSVCEARPEGILYRYYDKDIVYLRYYFTESYATKHIVTDLLKKEFDLEDIKIHRNINCQREYSNYVNVFALGRTIGNFENVICDDSLITQRILVDFVEVFKHRQIGVFSKKQLNEYIKDVFDEYANLTSLHYALTTRDDSRYWQDRLNQNYKIDFKKLKNVSLRETIRYFQR